MKLLFDQNLSPRLVERLADIFLDSSHVSFHGLERATDVQVWEFARENNYFLVTKDSDFYDLSLLSGFPPKVIWQLHFGKERGIIASISAGDYGVQR